MKERSAGRDIACSEELKEFGRFRTAQGLKEGHRPDGLEVHRLGISTPNE